MSPFYSATRDPRERERQSTCRYSIVLPVIPERERETVNMSPFYSATRDPRERERESQHVTIL